MQVTAKIVFYGPGLCGKTTNLQYIHGKTASHSRGEMVSLETETDRTLFFDLLPLDVGVISGMKVRLQLYTVPGQVFYNATRKLVLKITSVISEISCRWNNLRRSSIQTAFQAMKRRRFTA
jgi:GTPase SAR1 family protein